MLLLNILKSAYNSLIQRLKYSNCVESQNKPRHMKVLFSSFPKNGLTAWLIHRIKR